MQNNKINANRQNFSKRFLLETLDFLKYKIENDELTAGECASLARLVAQSLELNGTAEDFARFYGKSENNVRVMICRKMTVSPIRKVLYPFARFCRIVPDSWYDGITSQK